MEVACINCGKIVYRRPSAVTAGKRVYCSNDCRGRYMREHPGVHPLPDVRSGEENSSWKGGKRSIECAICGQLVWRYPSHIRGNVFCSHKCQGRWIKKNEAGRNHHNWKGHTITCAHCGAVHQRSPSLVKGKYQFCDNKCRGLWLAAQSGHIYKKDRNHDEIATALRDAGCSVFDSHLFGGGFPDLIVVTEQEVLLMEVKNPSSSHGMTPAQKQWHEQWRGRVDVVSSVDEALRLIGAIEQEDV